MDISELHEDEGKGKSKVIPLCEAVQRNIAPGMKLHVSTGNDPNAALREIIGQFWGKDPQFTLISSGITSPYPISLIHCKLVKKVITANCSYTYPTPRPIPLLQEAHNKGLIQIESWSLYSLEQRLMAAALGVGFMPTKSITATTLAEENADSFKVINDPFDGTEIGIVKALEPDISLVHGCVADKYGNTILTPPYFTSIWGLRASKNGVIVTVERLVPPEFIREHGSLVKIPAYLVRSVSVVPFGAHPQSLASEAIGINGGYSEDYDFILDYQRASRDLNKLNSWLNEWIIDCKAQQDYLRKLGDERVAHLRGKAHIWQRELDSRLELSTEPIAVMIVIAAREIRRRVIQGGHETMLAGIGIPALATWLAYYLLHKEGYEVDLLTGTGLIGYVPSAGDPFLMTSSNVMSCRMLTDTVEVYGTFVGGARNRCLGILGAAQIDKFGNINTLKMGNLYFIGAGGAADAVNASETLVVARQSRERLIEKVPFISCRGDKVKTLVTNLGVFEKFEGDKTFTLTKYFASLGLSKEAQIAEIKENCGWDLKVAEALEEINPPTTEELAILGSLDPQGLFIEK